MQEPVKKSFESIAKRQKILLPSETTSRLIENIKVIDAQLTDFAVTDRECCQVLWESRWLKSLLESGEFALPIWELSLFVATRNGFLSRYPQVKHELAELSKALVEMSASKVNDE